MAGPFNITTRGPMTAADWTALNPTLGQFEVGIEINAATGAYEKAKIGDGRTAWTSLTYWNPGGPQGVKVYRALLTQSGTDAPVATVLENTLGGTVVWTYNAVGKYIATLAGAFPSGRVWTSPPTGGDYDWLDLRRADDDSLRLETAIPNFALGDYTNGLLFSYSITILVYP